MSTDTPTLIALATKSGTTLRYFELVLIRFSGQTKHCYLCIGQHALYLLSGVSATKHTAFELINGGEIFYAHVSALVEDSQGTSDLLLHLNDNRPSAWESERLFVVSETRHRLVEHITVAWQTDRMWRFDHAEPLPRTTRPLRAKPEDGLLSVAPFRGCYQASHEGYTFFLRDTMKPTEAGVRAFEGGFSDESRGVKLVVRVSEPTTMETLEAKGMDHVRWAASELIEAVDLGSHEASVFRTASYLRRMNLSNDIACWTVWEVGLQTDSQQVVVMLLRRQYMPPLLDSAQDIVLTLRRSTPRTVTQDSGHEILAEARLIADTVSPVMSNCTVNQTIYRDLIKVKLDCLQVSVDAMKWIKNMTGMSPETLETEAKNFLMGLLQIMQDENVLSNADLIHEVGPDFVPDGEVAYVYRRMVASCTGDDATRNAWAARVAGFLAAKVDGGILGPQFTFAELTAPDLVKEQSRRIMGEAVTFMLHIRPKDMSRPFAYETVGDLILAPNPDEYTFNDRVMQSLLEVGWVQKAFPMASSKGKKSQALSREFMNLLAFLLGSDRSSVSLKAAVCRQIIAACEKELTHIELIIPKLMHTLSTGSIYLKTYATVTLVNLTNGRDAVKAALMNQNIGLLCKSHLSVKDDDLVRYTLALLTNLTKTMQYRKMLYDAGVTEVILCMVSTSLRFIRAPKLLAELCSVAGQVCNDDYIRKEMLEPRKFALDRLFTIFDKAEPGGRLRSKAMFFLKQLCADVDSSQGDIKLVVGRQVIAVIITDLTMMVQLKPPQTMDLDNATNACLLLLVLTIRQDNIRIMRKYKFEDLLGQLILSPLGETDSTRDRIVQLSQRLAQSHDEQY